MRDTIGRLRRTVGPRAIKLVDKRTRFRDLSRIPPHDRFASSNLLQFYSSVDNIGNYLPVLGIQSMLGEQLDTWCAHDRRIDYSFINAHYKGVIIGGAGLLHTSFTPFWTTFLRECRLPTIIWGIGACWRDGDPTSAVDPAIIRRGEKRFDLINVRDDPTASRYGWTDASITACPTVVFIAQTMSIPSKPGKAVLYASHPELVGLQERDWIVRLLRELRLPVMITDNRQRPLRGISDILKRYVGARVVATSRLHGAIIAYALGVPYVALARDEKLRAFHKRYGRGICVETPVEIPAAVDSFSRPLGVPRIDDGLEFGADARRWIETMR